MSTESQSPTPLTSPLPSPSTPPPPPPPTSLPQQSSPQRSIDFSATFTTDPSGPENPIHALDVFSRGLPVSPQFFSGFRRRQTEVEFTEPAMRQVMLNVDVRPNSLVMHPRAHLFPDKIESVVFQTKSSLFDQSLSALSHFEAFNRRRLQQAYSHGEVSDVQKVSSNNSLIPYGFFRKQATLLGSEVWQVKRRDQRATALEWYLEEKRKNQLGKQLAADEMAKMQPQEQMQRYRFLSDFGSIDIDSYPKEEQNDILQKIRNRQEMFPYIKTNYYRVNYYSSHGGDFFFCDVLPDERSDARQWMEFIWIRGSQFIRKNFLNKKEDQHGGDAQELNFSQGKVSGR